MKSAWEKFDIQMTAHGIDILSIRSLRQLRPYRNFYNFYLGPLQEQTEFNLVLIVEKKLGNILGYLKCQISATGELPLVASKYFDTFSIEKLELTCLEVVEFKIADGAWERLGFRNALSSGVSAIMNELGCEALLVHYRETFSDARNIASQIKLLPFHSPVVYCAAISNHTSDKQSPSAETTEMVNQNLFSKLFHNLVQSGLEIWSAPQVLDGPSELTLLLGCFSPQGLTQARPLSVMSLFRKESAYATR